MIKEILINAIKEVIGDVEFSMESPQYEDQGDYSTNVAMQVFSSLKGGTLQILKGASFSSPRDLATKLVEKISEVKEIDNIVSKIEVAGPGFINFFIKTEYLIKIGQDVLDKKGEYGTYSKDKDEKVIVEYTDPNPFKEFHIGHLYSNTVGESIARLIEARGAKVWRADYFGDVGMHVAKALWGFIEKLKEDNKTIEDIENIELKKRIEYLGQSYSKGADAFEEDESVHEAMKELNFLSFIAAQKFVLPEFNEIPQVDYESHLNTNLYDKEEIFKLYTFGRKWSLEYFEEIYERVGTKFDGYYPESRTGEYGYGMVMKGLEKGVFEKGEKGAIIFPGEKYGLHNRVFINSLGLPTYEAKDFGNAVAKEKDFTSDRSVIVTGNEIDEYFNVLLMALKKLYPELGEKTVHIGHGMVRLPEGKMSSRTGKIVRGEWLLDESKQRINKIIESSSSLSDTEKDQISEMVGVGAVKYALLKQGIGNNIEFDFNTSLSFEGNSGPYLQYTYARTVSVLGKAGVKDGATLQAVELNDEERSLLRAFPKFPEVIQTAAQNYAPNLLCNYLYDLAQKYNSFYARHKIVESENEAFRLTLTKATGIIIKNGLHLLGIKAPEKM